MKKYWIWRWIAGIHIWKLNKKWTEFLDKETKEEVAYFRSVEPEIKIIEGFILQGRVVTMNMDTYRGTVEYLWKKEYIDFSRIKNIESHMQAINDSLMKKEDVVIKCNIEYELWKIRLITILWVIPSELLSG